MKWPPTGAKPDLPFSLAQAGQAQTKIIRTRPFVPLLNSQSLIRSKCGLENTLVLKLSCQHRRTIYTDIIKSVGEDHYELRYTMSELRTGYEGPG